MTRPLIISAPSVHTPMHISIDKSTDSGFGGINKIIVLLEISRDNMQDRSSISVEGTQHWAVLQKYGDVKWVFTRKILTIEGHGPDIPAILQNECSAFNEIEKVFLLIEIQAGNIPISKNKLFSPIKRSVERSSRSFNFSTCKSEMDVQSASLPALGMLIKVVYRRPHCTEVPVEFIRYHKQLLQCRFLLTKLWQKASSKLSPRYFGGPLCGFHLPLSSNPGQTCARKRKQGGNESLISIEPELETRWLFRIFAVQQALWDWTGIRFEIEPKSYERNRGNRSVEPRLQRAFRPLIHPTPPRFHRASGNASSRASVCVPVHECSHVADTPLDAVFSDGSVQPLLIGAE